MSFVQVNRFKAAGFALAGIVVLIASSGCAKDGAQAKERKKAITSMRDTREELVEAHEQVARVIQAMRQLADAADPQRGGGVTSVRPAYERFADEVEETQKQGDKANRRAMEMRRRGREYIVQWEREMETVSDAELRASAAERRERVRENYAQMRESARAAREAYTPFIRRLRDLERSLAMDLTPQGVRAAQPALESARADGQNLQARLDELIGEIDRVHGRMSSEAQP